MSALAFVVTTDPLDLSTIVRFVENQLMEAPVSAGAVAAFLGTVRNENQGHRVDHLEYEAYEPLAVKAFQQIEDESSQMWPETHLAIHHRIGRLNIGDASVAIAAASPHRANAFSSCRYAIERIKQIAPIWKHEYFEGGDVWIEGATASPDDEETRQTAIRLACV